MNPLARVRRLFFTLALFGALSLPALAVMGPAAPPGFNVHLVRETSTGRFWRGGAPRGDTLEVLAASARKRHVAVTLFDLRTPPHKDDESGKDGRLTPAQEEALCAKLGLRYRGVNALDRKLPRQLEEALARGDVYIHCMYGVNRTGFAMARYACAAKVRVRHLRTGDAGLGGRKRISTPAGTVGREGASAVGEEHPVDGILREASYSYEVQPDAKAAPME